MTGGADQHDGCIIAVSGAGSVRAADPAIVAQFLKFGTVGTIGFLADTAVVYALRAPLGLYGAGMVSYLLVASANWALNRAWTFRGQGSGPAHRQWVRFLVANLLGLVLNRGTYAALVATVPLCASQPVFAVAAGSLAGMMVNFTLSRQMVFR
ncbi:MAG TPA: GtrA family protein [Acetobacteraceae bacterium]|nr:GtrA family protein [Acetobacteraceae bacterium]